MRVLIVEDEATLRAQLVEAIGAAGYVPPPLLQEI